MSNYNIIPKPDSPYAALDFPEGIPVTQPIPVHLSDGHLLWDLDLNRTTAAQLLGIAQLVATEWSIHVDEVIDGIKAAQCFGICHHHIERLIGDDSSTDELEGMGRSYRAKIILENCPDIMLCVSILDAVALYSELGQAVWILGSNDPRSKTAELVGDWLDTVLPAIAIYAPELAQVLTDKRIEDGDKMLSLLSAIDSRLEIKIGIASYTAYLAIGCLQLMSRNPDSRMTKDIRRYIRTLSAGILSIAPEVNWLLERGWHPEFDGGGE